MKEIEKEWYALIVPNGHIEFWRFDDKNFNKDVLWVENTKKEFKATLQEAKEYSKKYGLKFLFPSEKFEKEFNN